jgi:hypothetical protein
LTDCPDFSDIKILYLKNAEKASVEMHSAEEWGQRKYQTEQAGTLNLGESPVLMIKNEASGTHCDDQKHTMLFSPCHLLATFILVFLYSPATIELTMSEYGHAATPKERPPFVTGCDLDVIPNCV